MYLNDSVLTELLHLKEHRYQPHQLKDNQPPGKEGGAHHQARRKPRYPSAQIL